MSLNSIHKRHWIGFHECQIVHELVVGHEAWPLAVPTVMVLAAGIVDHVLFVRTIANHKFILRFVSAEKKVLMYFHLLFRIQYSRILNALHNKLLHMNIFDEPLKAVWTILPHYKG